MNAQELYDWLDQLKAKEDLSKIKVLLEVRNVKPLITAKFYKDIGGPTIYLVYK